MMSLPHTKKPCSGCPFRKDTMQGWLGKSRMQGILNQEGFVCHKKPDQQCAGHMLIKGYENDFVRLAGLMKIELALSGRDLVFDTADECANHHADGIEI
jgi:hypothetical protein